MTLKLKRKVDIASTSNTIATSWQSIDWATCLAKVKKLRGMIYKATKMGQTKLISRLQDIMLRSHANILVSIGRVTTINLGRRTPGLDKMLIKTNEERWQMVIQISAMKREDWLAQVKPAGRIYLPKPNGQFRPIGIASITDRVIQNMVKNALEPQWEALFESSSYGFRPKRSCHDALARVYNTLGRQKVRLWVLHADIKGCFDNINHQKLMSIIGDFPGKQILRAWLKAGYCEFPFTEIVENNAGTPQGGVISPLLANIALHGIEKELGIKTVSTTAHNYGSNTYAFIRYADDFVVLAKSKVECEIAKTKLEVWLKDRGLVLVPDKVRIVHASEGFKFLGCQVQIYHGKKLLITPHPTKVTALKEKLKDIWLKYMGQAPHVVIKELNPIIGGWANYYAPFVSSKVFSDLDHFMWHRSWRYAKRRHPMKNHQWIASRYFGSQTGSKNKWRFFGYVSANVKLFLQKFSHTKIVRHVMIQNNKNPDDLSPESLSYWEKKNAAKAVRKWESYPSKLKLSEKQYHICPLCNESLYNEEELHVHHMIQKKDGGLDWYGNLVILHEICHRQVHSAKMTTEYVKQQLSLLQSRHSAKLAK
jgi:RNA-directed DNA polymerase